ncbi:MAG: sugar phosphate nucleotidyltransferase [Candidatus Anstonellales archaeon]
MEIKKAVIPAAGLGTRLLPATKSQPKEMLPIVDRPAIQYVVEEAINSGIEDVLIITGRGKRTLEDHFDRSLELEKVLEAKADSQMLNSLKQSSYKYDFAIYYERLKEDYNVTLQHLRNKIDKNAYDYYENILSYAEQLKDKGYYYSASNTLFTNAVELMSFDAIINNRDVKKEAEQCINEAKSLKVESNKNNFELISGALFRLARAEERLIRKVEDNTKSAKAYLAKAHAESLEWCKFSSSLLNNAMSINGDKINEEAIKDYAVNYILSVDENSLTDEEKEFYMLGLKYAAKQDFITSAFYVAYLNSSLSSVQYKGQKLDGFWANVFASQAEYLYSISGNTASASSSFALALSFNNIYNLVTQSTVLEDTGLENINKGGNKTSIENISEEKLNESTNKSVNESSNEIKAKGQEENAASIALSLSLFIIAIILLYLLTKYYGNQEKRKKARYKYERR